MLFILRTRRPVSRAKKARCVGSRKLGCNIFEDHPGCKGAYIRVPVVGTWEKKMGFDLCVAGALRQPRCGVAACRVIVGGDVEAAQCRRKQCAARWLRKGPPPSAGPVEPILAITSSRRPRPRPGHLGQCRTDGVAE